MSETNIETVRATLLAKAHAVLAAVRDLDAAMAEHGGAKVGEDIARPLVAIRGRLEGVADFMAARLPPVERTPEVVLRVMLAESLKAWSDFEVEFYRVPDGSKEEEDAYECGHAALTRVHALQSALGFVLAGKDADMDPDLRADYLARLAGSTPLDAPPAEVP